MKKLRLLALIMIFAITISAFASCDVLMGGGTGTKTPQTQSPTTSQNDPEACQHKWDGGVCAKCKTECTHSYSGDTCEICGSEKPSSGSCTHTWVEGVCTGCGKECEHDFGTGIECTVCGEERSGALLRVVYSNNTYDIRYESTLGEFISENLNTTYEATVASGAYWMLVDPFEDKVTLSKDTYLNNYGAYVELYLVGGATPPPASCEHEWVDSYCDKCGSTCQHSWQNSVCTDCGKVCQHTWWMPGECGDCGLACEHYWIDNRCEICNYDCMHDGYWQDGECTMCGKECQHNWNQTQCEYCGMICNHEFDGPSCIKCGYTSGGIDNAIEVYYDGYSYHVPYSASFYDVITLFIGMDYYQSVSNGKWSVVTSDGTTYLMDESYSPAYYGRTITMVYTPDDIGGGGGSVMPGDCSHSWDNGTCLTCGMPCTHPEWKENYCAYCNYCCTHVGYWLDGRCQNCGAECKHVFENGVCKDCECPAVMINDYITVVYEGTEYFVSFDTTLGHFVNNILMLDLYETTQRGSWIINTADNQIYPDETSYFCDLLNTVDTIYLEYFSYGM